MNYQEENEVISLIERFEDCTVTNEEWTHAAHLTVAMWCALREDFEEAFSTMRAGIFKLNEAHGISNTLTRGYHETLTFFWMKTVFDYKLIYRDLSTIDLINHLIEDCDSDLPLRFYTRALLFSPAARAKYVEPDLSASESKI